MNANVYQTMAMQTAGELPELSDKLAAAALGLCGEAGEFADHVKKYFYHGHDLDNARVRKELGDILWYAALACEALETRLGDVMEENIIKLRERYPEGFSWAASVDRPTTG